MTTSHTARAFLSVAEVATRLNRHPDTVRGWIRAGLLPSVRPGGRGQHLIAEADLAAFLQRGARA